MDLWQNLVVGTLEIVPELSVLVNIIGAMFLLEIATSAIALLSGVRRQGSSASVRTTARGIVL